MPRFLITETAQYYLDMPVGTTARETEDAFCNMDELARTHLEGGDINRTVEEAD